MIASGTRPDFEPYFWIREKAQSNAEVDLLYPEGTRLYGLEVKSGPQGRLRSLQQFVERSGSTLGIRLLENRPSLESAKTSTGYAYRLLNVPMYAAAELRRYLRWARQTDSTD